MDVEFLKYQFEDGYAGIVVKNKPKPGVRHVQMVYMCTCAAVLGALRGAVGVGLLALTDHTRAHDTYIQIHEWDRRIQGMILSAFFFGYAAALAPTELLLRAEQLAGKHALAAALLANGALAAAMPTIANKGGWIAVCNAHLWMGVSQATLSPANRALLARWAPPDERDLCSCLVHVGSLVGIIVSLPISGQLSEARLGWELVYYAQAMLALSMAVVWALLTASAPDQHQAVGDAEKEFIREALRTYTKKVMVVPWRSILKCKRFWGAACAHAASHVLFVFFLVEVPVYLMTFGYSLKESAGLAALPFCALWALRTSTAPTLERAGRALCAGLHVQLTHYRKLINAIGGVGVIAGLTMVTSLPTAWGSTAVVTLTAVLGLVGFQYFGFLESFKDMSQNYAGTLLMLSSCVAAAAGSLVPVLSGLILGDDLNAGGRWQMVFLFVASVYVSCHAAYTALGSSERQPWDGGVTFREKFGYHNAVLDTNSLELEDLSDTRPGGEKLNDTAL